MNLPTEWVPAILQLCEGEVETYPPYKRVNLLKSNFRPYPPQVCCVGWSFSVSTGGSESSYPSKMMSSAKVLRRATPLYNYGLCVTLPTPSSLTNSYDNHPQGQRPGVVVLARMQGLTTCYKPTEPLAEEASAH